MAYRSRNLGNVFDAGQVMKDREDIQTRRIKNSMLATEQKQQEEMIANRDKARKIRAAMASMPEQIQELEAKGLFDEADKLRDGYINQQYNGVKMLTAMRAGINADNYKEWRSKQIQAGTFEPEMLPVEYSDDWFRKEQKKAKSTLQTHTRKWGEQGATFAQDFITTDGEITWEGKPYQDGKGRGVSGGAGSDNGFAMKSSDSNSIRNASASLFGGMWDPQTGQYSGLNKEVNKEVAAVSAEAAKIYAANEGRIPHDQAVARAARKIGINIPQLDQMDAINKMKQGIQNFGQPDPNDPLGWRK
jgi:hypothetical protein